MCEVRCESGACELKFARRLVQFFLLDTFENDFENNNNLIAWCMRGSVMVYWEFLVTSTSASSGRDHVTYNIL